MKKIIVAILAIVLFALPFSACKKDDDGLKKIELNEVTHSVFYAPLYVAIEKDFFKEEGLEIKLTNGGGADKVMTAVLSNSAQIGLMGPEIIRAKPIIPLSSVNSPKKTGLSSSRA